MRVLLAACLVALVALSGACGGRLIKSETDGSGATSGDGATTNTGATSNNGATSNDGARSSTAGTRGIAGASSGGAVGVGGTFGIAGTFSTGGQPCACPPIACPPDAGFQAVPNPDGCCYHCECNPMLCPGIACGSGSHLETPPGKCCPTCIQDDCMKQQAGYQDLKKALVEKYSSQICATANDCTIYYEKNQCASGCGIVMPIASLDNLDSNLQGYAQQNCSPGCPMLILPCDPPKAPICNNGLCQ